MKCLSRMNTVELVDLPDELILMIMNKVKSEVLLLCSIITVGNNRLEELALDKCHSIDLTVDYFQSPYKLLIQRFYSHVMPRIVHNIRLLTFNIAHIPDIINFAEKNCNGTLPNLTHLKIMMGRQRPKTGTSYTLGNHIYGSLRYSPLYSIVPEFVILHNNNVAEDLFTFLCSSVMRSIVSFELDGDCVLPDVLNDDKWFFPQSVQLTHLRLTLFHFKHCVDLLKQIGSQLYSFVVSFMYVRLTDVGVFSRIESISCPNLKLLTMTIYRNIKDYEKFFLRLLQRLINVEYLTLILAIGFEGLNLNRFIDGYDLEKDITSHMPHLRQFHFHIRSIIKSVSHVNIDTIRQSFTKQHEQTVDCAIDYFSNNFGQCQIYSLPFIGTRLDFISNRFPLFDTNNIFSMVTVLLLFDDVQPFENDFFKRVSRALPRLRTLHIFNELAQQDKIKAATNDIEFAHLATLILITIHLDYAEQFLCRIHLPSLTELAIDNDMLLTIISQNEQQVKDNCSRVETLRTPEPFNHSIDAVRHFFPLAFN